MKRSTILVFAILFFTSTAHQANAQYDYSDELYYDHPITYELGASLGTMNCFTDLGGKKGLGKNYIKDIDFGTSRIAGSVYFSVNYKYMLSLRAEATLGSVKSGDDNLQSVAQSTAGRYERNLSFRSNITEVMLALEFHPLFLKRYVEGQKIPRISPYVAGGIGFFAFNPQAKLNGQWIDLQPLSTEGQGFSEYPNRKPYKLRQFNFPVGLGIKYKLTPLFNVSLEGMTRILNTDYLDDVSTEYVDPDVYPKYFTGQKLLNALALNDRQKELDPSHQTKPGYQRGNPGKNDSYFTLNIKMSLVF